MNKILGTLLVGLMILALPISASANAWSSYSVNDLNSTDGWKWTAHGSSKTTSQAYWDAEASAMTMWSNPSKRMVNSNGTVRGTAVTISTTGTVYTGSSSGVANILYYAQVKPAWNQSGQDTITSRHKAR